jgi:hypothetical protein
VKVATPYDEIPWRKVSRLSDAEMKRLMKAIVNNLHTFLCRQDDPDFLDSFFRLGSRYAARWDEPERIKDFVVPAKRSRKRPRPGSGEYLALRSTASCRDVFGERPVRAPSTW